MNINERLSTFTYIFNEILLEKIKTGQLDLTAKIVTSERLLFEDVNGELRWFSTLIDRLDEETINQLEVAWNECL